MLKGVYVFKSYSAGHPYDTAKVGWLTSYIYPLFTRAPRPGLHPGFGILTGAVTPGSIRVEPRLPTLVPSRVSIRVRESITS